MLEEGSENLIKFVEHLQNKQYFRTILQDDSKEYSAKFSPDSKAKVKKFGIIIFQTNCRFISFN
uniref:Transposase n=1 Tax=Meloidogyne hapla TaxID=6305 RepID=A0A1I8BUR1_MELHA